MKTACAPPSVTQDVTTPLPTHKNVHDWLLLQAGFERSGPCWLPTPQGEFRLYCFREFSTSAEHVAIVFGKVDRRNGVLVRIHSECLTGEALHSLRCDCDMQLQRALSEVAQAGCGVIVYLRQEGRGIGLFQKVRAYMLQDAGADTVDANIALGFREDERDFTFARSILDSLGVQSIVLLTNNPAKTEALRDAGVVIDCSRLIEVPCTAHNSAYLDAKARRMGHLIGSHLSATVE